jgi:hypothetical protein
MVCEKKGKQFTISTIHYTCPCHDTPPISKAYIGKHFSHAEQILHLGCSVDVGSGSVLRESNSAGHSSFIEAEAGANIDAGMGNQAQLSVWIPKKKHNLCMYGQ